MRTRAGKILVLVTAMLGMVFSLAAAEPSGPYFGDGNIPPGCVLDQDVEELCYHMKLGLNALDSPKVDVLVMVPASPTVERDMRIMRQSAEMWEAGIDYLAAEMGMTWLEEGLDFRIFVESYDPGQRFTAYPIADPEIVILASNPVGGIGIGIDPVDFFFDEAEVCHGVPTALGFEGWEGLPGFDSHHDGSGTYREDCGGEGGNICLAVNGALDPVPGDDTFYDNVIDFQLFDLVSHEFGHCLTIGHVGDGADGDWAVVPTNDIMAYDTDPPGISKCVSTLDVEGLATRMSRYLDVNGDGVVDGFDELLANDQVGDGRLPFQIQHPDDHRYASATGDPMDCPQPDLGLVPGEPTDWDPRD